MHVAVYNMLSLSALVLSLHVSPPPQYTGRVLSHDLNAVCKALVGDDIPGGILGLTTLKVSRSLHRLCGCHSSAPDIPLIDYDRRFVEDACVM